MDKRASWIERGKGVTSQLHKDKKEMIIVQQDMYFVLKSYKEQLKVVKQYRETLKQKSVTVDEAEAFLAENDPEYIEIERNANERKLTNSICGGIQSDLEYVIEWIETGRQPGALRGNDRRSVYELTYHMDPLKLERFAKVKSGANDEAEETVLSERDKYRIEDALSVLTPSEKDVFLLYHVERFSLSAIAEFRNVKKTSVQNQLERAKRKIQNQTSCSLFAFAI